MTASSGRTANVARNSAAGLVAQLAVFVLGLIYRSVFLHYLSVEYLGAQSLFGDVLNLLSLAELGIGNAVLFSMYAPLARRDYARVAALMSLYRRLYRWVGLAVLVIGGALTPFLDHLVKSGTDLEHFRLIYLLLLADVVVGYWSAYRKSIFIADQQEYKVTLTNAGTSVVRNIVQILALVLTGSFLLVLAIKVVGTLATNLLLSVWAKRSYAEVFSSEPGKLDRDFLSDYVRKLRALLMHRVSGLVMNATDSILIARFFGLTPAGVYSNYLLIVGMATSVISQVASATTASVGHLAATEPVEHSRRIFGVMEFYYRWIYGFATLSLLTLLNPFLGLWLGSEYTFGTGVVAAVCLNFYLIGRRLGVQSFRNALGLFWVDRWRAPVEAVTNLGVSLLLLHWMGIAGIFVGTAVSMLLLSIWIEPYVLFKHYFDQPVRPYLLGRLAELGETVLMAVPLLLLQSAWIDEGALGFVGLALACLVGINTFYFIRFRGRSESEHLVGLVKPLLGRLNQLARRV